MKKQSATNCLLAGCGAFLLATTVRVNATADDGISVSTERVDVGPGVVEYRQEITEPAPIVIEKPVVLHDTERIVEKQVIIKNGGSTCASRSRAGSACRPI